LFLLLTKSISVEKVGCGPYGLLATFLACGGALDDSQNLVLAHNQQLFAVEFDLLAAVFAKKHAIARFNVQRLAGAVLSILAFADGHNFALLGLFFRAIGNNDSPAHLFAFFDAPQNHAVVKRSDIYCHTENAPFLLFLFVDITPLKIAFSTYPFLAIQ
jgi:hypothetical protein